MAVALSQAQAESRYGQIVAKVQRQRRLFSAHWELTYRCNELCTHCYLDVLPPGSRVPGELTIEECKSILDQLASEGVLNLTFSGGEILVRCDFFKIAEYARKKGFALTLYTNGILIKPTVADRIAALHPFRVEISIYGSRAETHDRITLRPRSFELTGRACQLLIERGVRVQLKAMLMHENVHELHEMRGLASGLGANFKYDITITPKDTGDLSPLVHRMTDEDLLWLFRETIDEKAADMWRHKLTSHLDPGHRFCGITLNSLLVDPYGEVYPCVQTRISAGNLREQSIRQIWRESPVWERLGNLTLESLPVCSTCELKSYCTRCHGLAMMADGDLHTCASICQREARLRRQVLQEKGVTDNGKGRTYQ
ncbi:MAG: radical SAM protein [Acidobacteria bacterium]|nr:radical SAM protein [Acidobacteriota bacterium]